MAPVAVYGRMGYILGLVVVLILIPLLFMMLSRRTRVSGGIDSADHGVTPDRPAADEPTPRAGPNVDRKIPPA
jgi:hypothetical protein